MPEKPRPAPVAASKERGNLSPGRGREVNRAVLRTILRFCPQCVKILVRNVDNVDGIEVKGTRMRHGALPPGIKVRYSR